MNARSMIVRQFWPNGAWYNDSDLGLRLRPFSDAIMTEWFALHESPPETLFHYTNADGLLGILNSNTLWATQADYLNDSSELVYARDRISKRLTDRLAAESDPETVAMLSGMAFQREIGIGIRSYHVACLCENGDLLSQWRGYGRDGGYAVGLRVSELGAWRDPPPPYVLRKVIYDQAHQDQVIGSLIEKSLEAFNSLSVGCPPRDVPQIRGMVLSMFTDYLDQYTVCFKDPLFQEEHEWRIVESSLIFQRDEYLPRLKFRRMPGGIAPYIELDLSPAFGRNREKLPICSITHGPMLNPQLAKESLQQLLRKYDYSFATVRGTGIPLRF